MDDIHQKSLILSQASFNLINAHDQSYLAPGR